MQTSGIVIAGGLSNRFGQNKGLTLLAGKPLIKHVLNSLEKVAEELIVVVDSKAQAARYSKAVGSNFRILVDSTELHGPVAGAITGFEAASGEYSVLLPCDTPFVSSDVLSLLVELCINRNAAIPRWPNSFIEPLQAVYRSKPAAEAAAKALCTGEVNMRAMVNKLSGVRYVSTMVIEQFDSEFRTFFNVNTPADLRRAEMMVCRHMDKRPR